MGSLGFDVLGWLCDLVVGKDLLLGARIFMLRCLRGWAKEEALQDTQWFGGLKEIYAWIFSVDRASRTPNHNVQPC